MADQRPQDPRHNASEDPGRAIVPYGTEAGEKPRGRDPFWVAFLWCLLGSIAMCEFTLIGCAMVGYGAAVVWGARGIRARVAAPGEAVSVQPMSQRDLWFCIGGTAIGLVLGLWLTGWTPLLVAELVVDVALAWVVARLVVAGRSNVSSGYLLATIVTLVYLGLASLSALAAGMTPVDAAKAMVNAAVELTASGSTLDVAAQMRSVENLLVLLWPFAYFVLGGLNVLCAHAGARVADTVPGTRKPWRLADFEAPTWSVVALIVAVAVAGVGSLGVLGSAGGWLQSAGLCIISAVRFVFMLQGFGVLTWWLSKHRLGCFIRFLVLFLAVDLEASFLVVSLLGLVDFWANLRHLPRGQKPEGTKA